MVSQAIIAIIFDLFLLKNYLVIMIIFINCLLLCSLMKMEHYPLVNLILLILILSAEMYAMFAHHLSHLYQDDVIQ